MEVLFVTRSLLELLHSQHAFYKLLTARIPSCIQNSYVPEFLPQNLYSLVLSIAMSQTRQTEIMEREWHDHIGLDQNAIGFGHWPVEWIKVVTLFRLAI